MKTTELIKYAFCILIFVSFACEDELEPYTIDAPSDLQERIDSIAAAKDSRDTGDTTYLNINTTIVGAEDYSSPWFTDFSDYFAVPAGRMLTLEFINHNGGSPDNFRNWVAFVSNEAGDRDADNYEEFFALRADAYGWGNGDFDIGIISHNYPDLDGNDDIWNDFRQIMDGAYVTLQIDHSATGYVFFTATAVGLDGTELVMTYNQPVNAPEVNVFLVADGSYFEMEEAYLLPSQVTEIVDANPVSLQIAEAPSVLEIGNEDFWGDATATVTYDDGSSSEVDSADLSFNVVPDMATVGEKTVIVAYNKTKQGEFTQAISAFYNLNVINAVSSLEVTTLPEVTTYTFPGPAAPVFDPAGLVVTATYSDGSTGVIANDVLQYDNPGGEGVKDVVISYTGAAGTVSTTVSVTNVTGGINQVGATDFSSPFFSEFSNEYKVASGSSKTFKMRLYSSEANNYNSPVVVLRRSDLSEYGAVRMDNYGWSGANNTAANLDVLGWTLTNDWDFDVFAENLDDSEVTVTVTNMGNGTANVRYDVTYANGDTHFQLYEGITVDSSNLYFGVTVDGCYFDVTSVE